MSNSNLVSYIDLSTGNYDERTGPISRITIHHAAGITDNLSYFSSILKSGRQCSWNYAIDVNGKIGIYVDEKYRAWTSGSYANDGIAVTMEVSNSTTAPEWRVSDASYKAIIDLCEDICRRNGIKELTYTGTLAGSNLTMHQWFQSTECPGPYLKSKFPDIAKQVNARLKKKSNLKYIQNPTVISVTNKVGEFGSTSSPQLLLNTDSINPYIVTISRNTKTFNASKLKDFGVVGAVIEAGRLFDASHLKMNYRNPKIDAQIKSANDANMPFGLYADVCAKNVEEAKSELRELRFIVRAYPPMIGVWLRIYLSNTKVVNDSIIRLYKDSLYSWGFEGRVGLYATRDQINKISWKDKWSKELYLWLDSHLTSLTSLDELLTPALFSV